MADAQPFWKLEGDEDLDRALEALLQAPGDRQSSDILPWEVLEGVRSSYSTNDPGNAPSVTESQSQDTTAAPGLLVGGNYSVYYQLQQYYPAFDLRAVQAPNEPVPRDASMFQYRAVIKNHGEPQPEGCVRIPSFSAAKPSELEVGEHPKARTRRKSLGQAEIQRRKLAGLQEQINEMQKQLDKLEITHDYLQDRTAILHKFVQHRDDTLQQLTPNHKSETPGDEGNAASEDVSGADPKSAQQALERLIRNWKPFINHLSILLSAKDVQDPGSSSYAALRAAYSQMGPLFDKALSTPGGLRRFLSLNLETMQEESPPPYHYQRVVAAMAFTPEQRRNIVIARDIFLSQMGKLLAERGELLSEAAASAEATQGALACGLPYPLELAQRLADNLALQHQVVSTMMWVVNFQIMTEYQLAQSNVLGFPFVPDTLALGHEIAMQEGQAALPPAVTGAAASINALMAAAVRS